MFVYKVLTSSELVYMSKSWSYLCPYHNLLPGAACCCLQTCNFVAIFMLMNNVCVQSFNFMRASMCKL